MVKQCTPVMLCIDVEPDKPFNHRANPMPWEGYQRAVEFVSSIRPELERLTSAPVHVSWFYRMDPQVAEIHGDPGWAITAYADEAKTLLAAGDEFGLHTHPIRWDDKANTWIQDYGNQRWVEHSLRMAFDTFNRQLNRPCVTFRFGDRWMNNQTFRLLETLGIRFDLTLEPGTKKLPTYHTRIPHTGSIPDQRSVPRTIYRPAKSNYQKRDAMRMDGPFVIPVSTAPIHLGTGVIYQHPGLLKGLYYRLSGSERIKNWTHPLNVALESQVFRSILDYNLRTIASPYLTMVARAHVFSSAEFSSNVRANLEALADYTAARGDTSFRFMTPAEAVECLQGAGKIRRAPQQ